MATRGLAVKRIVLAAALALAACGQQPQPKQEEEFPAVAAPNYDTSIGPNGAAGIVNTLAMDVDAVRLAVPNYIVAAVEDQVDGQAFTAITLSAGDEEVFRLLPDAEGAHLHAVRTFSSQARGPQDEVIGVTLFATAPAEETSFCVSELVRGAPGFACSTDASGTFWRVYTLPDAYDGPSDPFDSIEPDVLHEAALAEMRWIAPRY